MGNTLPQPMCFVAMPFGKKSPVGKQKPLIDFDLIYEQVRQAVSDTGFDCVRADFEAAGGFIHRPMYERLLVAEYVIADLTLANPNVAYEVGVRHGSRSKATILICAQEFVGQLPFDLKPLRVFSYSLNQDGNLSDLEAEKLKQVLSQLLKQAVRGELPPDNPILQVTEVETAGRIQHEKTDVFLKRMRYASGLGERIDAAMGLADRAEAIELLQAIEQEVLRATQVVVQLHSALISLYLSYREKKAYSHMVALYDKLPRELQRTPVAIEQLALALNRLAEASADTGDMAKARQLRREALHRLGELEENKWTSETYGIAGRIYKGQAEAEQHAGNSKAAAGALERAIETYQNGFRFDPRDYYPGVNAVSLKLRRGTTKDLEELATLVPVVRFSVDRAPAPQQEMEHYWQQATKLELACAVRDWGGARKLLPGLLAIGAEDWMRETTIKNLRIQQQAFAKDRTAGTVLGEIIGDLKPH